MGIARGVQLWRHYWLQSAAVPCVPSLYPSYLDYKRADAGEHGDLKQVSWRNINSTLMRMDSSRADAGEHGDLKQVSWRNINSTLMRMESSSTEELQTAD